MTPVYIKCLAKGRKPVQSEAHPCSFSETHPSVPDALQAAEKHTEKKIAHRRYEIDVKGVHGEKDRKFIYTFRFASATRIKKV